MPSSINYYNEPTCFERMKMGFKIGFCIGLASGGLLGGLTALRCGMRGRELFQNVGKGMVQTGGSFGMFMAIGNGIRC